MALPIAEKPEGVRCLGTVKCDELLAAVRRIPDHLWIAEDARKENDFDCFDDTRHIIFRFISGNIDPRHSYSNPAWNVWRQLLEPIIEAAVADYGFREPRFPKAMLARLRAGGTIARHHDGAGSNLLTHKIHVPLITNDQAVFFVEDVPFHLAAQHAYEVNNIKRHGAFNGGAQDRIHLIFEAFDAAATAGATGTAPIHAQL